MKAETLFQKIGADFYTGVPDSQLKALCNFLMTKYGTDPEHHIIAANEGNCTAIAAGYHLATGKVAVVYMQNSGEGNIVNPAASLLHTKVYGIPVLFVVGWRGEPGVHDEPQHIFQGEITLKLLEDLEIEPFVISKDTEEEEIAQAMERFRELFASGRSAAFVVRKGALTYDGPVSYENEYTLTREEAIRQIAAASGEDPVVSTTGKASRELFEIREAAGEDHSRDFLTVGSMGHASSIALGVALQRKDRRVWCIDGDGAALMHLGAMGVIGRIRPENLVHVVINNGAHETVGGMPTAVREMDLLSLARACGYPSAISVQTAGELEEALAEIRAGRDLQFLEVKCAIGAREDLGRPTTSARENKQKFMSRLLDNSGRA